VFWGLGEGAIAAILLYAGGLGALQSATLALGAPFSVVMFIMMYCLVRSFREELQSERPVARSASI